jgi:hypothetical protein
MSDKAADAIFKSLAKGWRQEANSQRVDVDAFKDRLEHRWGKALGKLRLLLTISREWGATAYESVMVENCLSEIYSLDRATNRISRITPPHSSR